VLDWRLSKSIARLKVLLCGVVIAMLYKWLP
jgi:hypothetical protein